MTSVIASLQRYCVGSVPMTKLLRHYRNLIARNWPRNTNALMDGNPVSYFNSSCRINHLTSLSVHIWSYVMILIAKYNILTSLQQLPKNRPLPNSNLWPDALSTERNMREGSVI